MKRHDLVFVNPQDWRALLARREDLAADALAAAWIDRGWPLIARRALPGEERGVALGLPLPPSAGKRRISIVMQPDSIVSICPPPELRAARHAAPPAWLPTIDRLGDLARRHAAELRVFGSLAWQALTGLNYVTDRSDLDLLFRVGRHTDLADLAGALAEIEATASMRLDGELVRDDGAAVNWRELGGEAHELLVKEIGGVALYDRSHFLSARGPS